MKAYKQFVIA